MAAAALAFATTGATASTPAGEVLADDPSPGTFAGEFVRDDQNSGGTAGETLADDSNPASAVSEHDQYRDNLLNPTFDVLSEIAGFQAGGLEPDRDEMLIYWHGEFGKEAQAAVAEAKSRGVPVNVHFVPYSYDELRAIADPLVDALAGKGIELGGYQIGDPFDEIAVWGSALDGSADARRVAVETAADVLPGDLRFAIIKRPDELVPLDSRHADGGQPTPWNGFEVGSLPGDPACSSALGWEDPGFRFYMQSAAHCVEYANNETVQFDGNPYNAGTYSGYIATLVGNPNSMNSADVLLDATLIGVPATPSIAGEMFFGPNTSSSKQDIPSIGAIPTNTTLCTNGSATGTHCNTQRGTTAVIRKQLCTPTPVCRYFDLVSVNSTNTTLMFGGGDSGGNLYRLTEHRVVATISAASNTYPCGSANYYSPDAPCTKTSGWITEMSSVAAELDEQNPDLVPRLLP